MYYDNLAKLLNDRLEPEDEHVLADCAQAMAEIVMVNTRLNNVEDYMTIGAQGPGVHPLIRVRTLAHAQFLATSRKLGLSPSDRHSLLGGLQAKEPEGGPSDFDKQHGEGSA